MVHNYFQGSPRNPYHISVGAVVRNQEGKIGCHYFSHFSHPDFGECNDFHLLMRETLEPNETIEQCLSRGLQEEFGAEAKLVSYLGSITSHFPKEKVVIEKTTLYFLCDLISFDETKRSSQDPEGRSSIQWLDVEDLILKKKEEAERLGREDVDETVVLKRMM